MEKGYKWHLRAGSKKDICPACGHKRFVPYVDAAGNLAGEQYGRCDREDNCGYICYPNGVPTDSKPQLIKVMQPIRFSPAVVYTSHTGNLFNWAQRLVGHDEANRAWNAYRVGAFNNYAIFWQIDNLGEVRSGKLMEYNENGHRVKDGDVAHVRWAHKSRYYNNTFSGEELEQCFFGEHLLKAYPMADVCVVESEKTAVMMSIFTHGYIWLACGGSCGLKNEKRNKVLEGRNVILFPDNGKYWEWRAIAKQNGWSCSDYCEKNGAHLGEGYDILDIYEYEQVQRNSAR